MSKFKRGRWRFILMGSVFLVCLIVALADPADKTTHLGAYIYGVGLLIAIVGLILTIRKRI
jgi:uncharacterized membrane protein HdeD (DUF308 family)